VIPALHFLLRFVAAASLGMGLLLWWGADYVNCVAPVVNLLAKWTQMPFQMLNQADQVLYSYSPDAARSFRLLATDQESIYLNLISMAAVFAATPDRKVTWRLGWGTLALGLLWSTHVISFYLGGQVALWQFAMTSAHAQSLAQPLALWIPQGHGLLSLKALETWNLWGRYSLCVLVWIVARARPEPLPALVAETSRWYVRHWILRPSIT
jgi:hypothetical protein